MTLTLPQAGTSPGRAPRTVEQPVNTAGQELGQLGDALYRLGAEKLDRNKKRAQVDLTRDMNDLRLQVEEIGDPDQADTAWQQGVSNLRAKYLGSESGQSEVLHPSNVPDFELTFDQLANANTFAVGKRNLELRMSERMATFDSYMYEASRAAMNADADTRATLAQTADDHIAGLLQNGVINAEQAEKMRQDVRGEIDGIAALQALNDDPAAFLDKLDEGEFSGLDADAQVRWRSSAMSALRKEAEKAQRKAEQDVKEYEGRVVDNLNRISSISDTGRLSPNDLALVNDPGVIELAKTNEDVALALGKANAKISLDERKPDFQALPLPDLVKLRADEAKRTVSHPYQEQELEILDETIAWKQQEIEHDALGHMAKIGLPPPDLPLDEGLDAFRAGLARRRRYAAGLVEKGHLPSMVVLTPEDRKEVKAQLEETTDPTQRRMLVEGFTRELGRDAGQVILRATGNRVTAHTATLIEWGASPDLVEDVLTGQKRLADGTATRPSPAAWRETFSDLTGDMFADRPETLARLQDSAAALYALSNPVDESGEIDTEAARTAISRALGGDGMEAGGLAEINSSRRSSYMLPLPPGMSDRHLEDAISIVSEKIAVTVTGTEVGGAATVSDGDLSILQAAAIRGAPPDFKGMSPRVEFETAQIVPLWPDGRPVDQYVLIDGDTGAAYIDTNGQAYVFSLRKLVAGARR